MPVSYNLSQFFDFRAKPYQLLCLSAFVSGAVALLQLFFDKDALDINMHDSYLIITHAHLSAVLGIVLLFLWLIYIVSQKILLSKALTWLHVTFTILSVLGFIVVVQQQPEPHRYYAIQDNFPDFDGVATTITIILSFITAQLIFTVNLLGGGIKRVMEK